MAGYEVFERTPGCITVAVSAWPPLVMVDTMPFSGTQVSIFRLIMERMKQCYYLAATPDQQWGDKLNGTWTGMVGMIDRKQADVAMGPLGVTLLRTEVVDFAMAYMNSDNNFLYKAITHIQPDMLIFTKSFETQVWEYTAASIVVVGIFSVLMHYGYNWARKMPRPAAPSKVDDDRVHGNGVLQMLWSLMIFLAQDPVYAPKGDAGRVLGIMWMFMCLILSLMYRCNLKAILITSKITPPFDSMEEFVLQREYKWTLVDGTYYGGYFKGENLKAPDTDRGMMWPLKDVPVKDAASVVPVSIAQKVAVVAPRFFHKGFIALDFSAHGECRLAMTKKGFHDIYLTFAYPKKSPLREPMDTMILRVIQAGLPDQIQDYQLRNASWCINPKKSAGESRPFGIGDFLGLYAIYGLGMTIAVVVFVGEIVVAKINGKMSDGRRGDEDRDIVQDITTQPPGEHHFPPMI